MKKESKRYKFRVKQLLLLCMMFLMAWCNCVPVYATENLTENESTNDDSSQLNSQETRIAILEAARSAGMINNFTDEQEAAFAQCVADVVLALRAKGLSENAIGGIMLNYYAESHFDPFMIQGEMSRQFTNFEFKTNNAVGLKAYDENMNKLNDKDISDSTKFFSSKYTGDLGATAHSAVGIFQCEKGRRNDLVAYASTLTGVNRCVIKLEVPWDTTVADENGNMQSVRSYELVLPSATLQVGFMLENPTEGATQWNAGKANLAKWGLPEMSWDEFLHTDQPVDVCAKMFAVCYERPGNQNAVVNENSRTSEGRLNFINTVLGGNLNLSSVSTIGNSSGTVGADGSFNSVVDTVMTGLSTSGFFSEQEISAYCKLSEINVESEWLAEARRVYLSNRDIYELANWERNVKSDTIQNKLIKGGRTMVVFVGILFEIWSLLIYLAYWFDRINNFIEIDLLSILTFGRLRIADDTSKATYSLRHNVKNKVKTVNHRAVLFIAVIGLAFGTLIISGRIFTILYQLTVLFKKIINGAYSEIKWLYYEFK